MAWFEFVLVARFWPYWEPTPPRPRPFCGLHGLSTVVFAVGFVLVLV